MLGLLAAAPLALAAAALAAPASHAIVVGRGIDGVQLGQTRAQVRSRLGEPPCGCDGDVWLYGGAGYRASPVAGVDFAPGGGVVEVFALGSRTANHLTTSSGVGLGSTLASVEHAYRSAQCYFIPGGARHGGPQNGRCAIVSRSGASDADTAFIAGAGEDANPGAIDEVAVDVLASAAAETIKVSISPKSIPAGRASTAKLTVVVRSPAFYDFPNGVGIAGDHLKLSSTDRRERISRLADHGNGTYTATITSSSSVGVAKITATDGAVSGRAKLRQARFAANAER